MERYEINKEYFNWLYDLVRGNDYGDVEFYELFSFLHEIPFRYSIPMDANRCEDGVDLRWRFAYEQGYEHLYDEVGLYLARPCTVLEMLVALTIRSEEDIFWTMLYNLNLHHMCDGNFHYESAIEIVDIFLDREYAENGEGGLFIIDCDEDLREVEIWYQMCWYLDSIL